MTGAEQGFLLLASTLGDAQRKPLTTAQMRTLAQRARQAKRKNPDRELQRQDLQAMGYGLAEAEHIVALLSETALLREYLHGAARTQCQSITRVSDDYPCVLRSRLGEESPGVLWAKGEVELLHTPMISLVGSRDIRMDNRIFAWEVGRQAALQGYTLVSGNARGADKIAQEACLTHGGNVICVVADSLAQQKQESQVLYLSEEDYDAPFSSQRALSRNRVIHALGEKTFVAQCQLGKGGTWDGCLRNLRRNWSPVFCLKDGSGASAQLEEMGARQITAADLGNLAVLTSDYPSLFDQ